MITTPPPNSKWDEEEWWHDMPITWEEPVPLKPEPFPEESPIDLYAKFKLQRKLDWLTNPVTALEFDGSLVGKSGRLNPIVQPATNSRVELGSLGRVALDASREFTLAGNNLNVIGASGLSRTTLVNSQLVSGVDAIPEIVGGAAMGGWIAR